MDYRQLKAAVQNVFSIRECHLPNSLDLRVLTKNALLLNNSSLQCMTAKKKIHSHTSLSIALQVFKWSLFIYSRPVSRDTPSTERLHSSCQPSSTTKFWVDATTPTIMHDFITDPTTTAISEGSANRFSQHWFRSRAQCRWSGHPPSVGSYCLQDIC